MPIQETRILKRLLAPLVMIIFSMACDGIQEAAPVLSTMATDVPAIPATAAPVSSPTAVPISTITVAPVFTATFAPELIQTIDPSHKAFLPDPRLTPGDVMSVSITDICTPGYASRVRTVPEGVKNQVYIEYGIFTRKPREYEVDHLVSLELGGSNSIRNLWPEPYTGAWNAHFKDKLENKLHELVCNGNINLESAQQEIATDWVAAYIKVVGQP